MPMASDSIAAPMSFFDSPSLFVKSMLQIASVPSIIKEDFVKHCPSPLNQQEEFS
jgi:hypothetical protein